MQLACTLARPLQDLSTVVFAYARLRFNAPGALLRIQDRVLRSIDTAAPLDMALLLWGFARLGFAPREELMRRLGASVVRQLGAFKPRVRNGAREREHATGCSPTC
jgi:hypothetical protein